MIFESVFYEVLLNRNKAERGVDHVDFGHLSPLCSVVSLAVCSLTEVFQKKLCQVWYMFQIN